MGASSPVVQGLVVAGEVQLQGVPHPAREGGGAAPQHVRVPGLLQEHGTPRSCFVRGEGVGQQTTSIYKGKGESII